MSLVGVLLGLGVRAIDGLAACDEVAGDKTVIDETFARALCDVGVECEDSICRQLAFEALAATDVFRAGDGGRSGGSSWSRGARECAGELPRESATRRRCVQSRSKRTPTTRGTPL